MNTTETDYMLDEIKLTLKNDKQSAKKYKSDITSVKNELVGLQDKYSVFIAQLDADVDANPDDEYLVHQKKRKDAYLKQWKKLKDAVVLLNTAANGVAIP